MSEIPRQVTVVGLETPDFRIRGILTFLLRLGVGMPLLTSGLNGFWAIHAAGANAFGGRINASPMLLPGMEELYLILPYAQIVVALAILLGFLTIAAATASAVLSVFPSIVQILVMIVSGGAVGSMGSFGSANNPYLLLNNAMMMSGQSGGMLLTLLLIWLASIGWNGWSLDGLVFQPKKPRPLATVALKSATPPDPAP